MAQNLATSRFSTPAKLTIRDVLDAQQVPDNKDEFTFRTLRFRAVDIMGVITGRKCINTKILYTIDDCTGVINCMYDYERPAIVKERCAMEQLRGEVDEFCEKRSSELSQAMQHIMSMVEDRQHTGCLHLEQGDCAHVRGFITDFHGQRQVNAFQLEKVESITHEEERIYEYHTLFSHVYSKLP